MKLLYTCPKTNIEVYADKSGWRLYLNKKYLHLHIVLEHDTPESVVRDNIEARLRLSIHKEKRLKEEHDKAWDELTTYENLKRKLDN